MKRRHLSFVLIVLAGCANTGGEKPVAGAKSEQSAPVPRYAAEIRRTSFGIPHIKAEDDAGLGYGIGYAYAQDNLCLLADQLVTVNGERARWFGEKARTSDGHDNLPSDYFFQWLNRAETIDTAWKSQTPAARALLDGYAAGFNHYLKDTPPDRRPAACARAAWVRPIASRDLLKLFRRYAVEGGLMHFANGIVAAQPPGNDAAAMVEQVAGSPWPDSGSRTGSNVLALGRDATVGGRGMLLGNPHLPWSGALRFYELHTTIPGQLDVMGAALPGYPGVQIGFTRNFAWSHTVDTAAHFTIHQLQLDPTSPTRYVVDRESIAMTRTVMEVKVKEPDGTLTKHPRVLYSSRFGPIVAWPGQLGWDKRFAYALRDANIDNHRTIAQWYAMNRAPDLAAFRAAVESILGVPWVNTVAADRQGTALFLDVAVVPNLSARHLEECVPEAFRAAQAERIFVLDGSRSACDWVTEPGTPQPGIYAASRLPALERTDFVQSSNDSAWLTNPAQPLTGFPSIVSRGGSVQNGRTRFVLDKLHARLTVENGRFDLPAMQQLLMGNEVYLSSAVMEDVLALCEGQMDMPMADGTNVDVSLACDRLATWDRTANLDANQGYIYFAGFMQRARKIPNVWAVPFDPADPVHTPRGLNRADTAVAVALRHALATVVHDVDSEGIPSKARWGNIQFAVRGESRIPMHGGDYTLGIYNHVRSEPIGGGERKVVDGASYIQAVTFDAEGPQAQALLAYSQSDDPASAHFADQTWQFSNKAWVTLPFTEEQIRADPAYRTLKILE